MSAERIPQILKASLIVFSASGLSETRMEDISAEAGLSKATLYLYFKNKDELILALLSDLLDRGRAALELSAAEERPVRQTLLDWVDRTTGELTETAAYSHLGLEFLALGARNDQAKSMLGAYFTAYMDAMAQLFRKGIATGEFRPVDAVQSAKSLISILEGMHLLWLACGPGVDLEVDSHAAVCALLDGFDSGLR
ncbi:MAG: TetR/AcrR family transcriptional regulator [Alphaproteobacteria bacterium]|nr:TetR/AcrR family transcriptional regulator [Alphaproteobacteria bacterium]